MQAIRGLAPDAGDKAGVIFCMGRAFLNGRPVPKVTLFYCLL